MPILSDTKSTDARDQLQVSDFFPCSHVMDEITFLMAMDLRTDATVVHVVSTTLRVGARLLRR